MQHRIDRQNGIEGLSEKGRRWNERRHRGQRSLSIVTETTLQRQRHGCAVTTTAIIPLGKKVRNIFDVRAASRTGGILDATHAVLTVCQTHAVAGA